MRQRNLDLLALCGTIYRSPLAVSEALTATNVPVLSLLDLGSPDLADNLMAAGSARLTASAPNDMAAVAE